MSSLRSLYQPQSQEYFSKLYSFTFCVQVHDPLWIKIFSLLLLGVGVRNGNPLQYSCLENSMGRGAWQATVHGVTESDTIEQLTHRAQILLFSIWIFSLFQHHLSQQFSFTHWTVLVSLSKTIWPYVYGFTYVLSSVLLIHLLIFLSELFKSWCQVQQDFQFLLRLFKNVKDLGKNNIVCIPTYFT